MVKTLSILCLLIVSATAAPCPVKWDPQAAAMAYRIWRGIDCIATTTEAHAVLELPVDQLSTLTVTACNAQGESEHSDPLHVLPVTPQASTDLRTWTDQKPFFIRATHAAFFRFFYPQPSP